MTWLPRFDTWGSPPGPHTVFLVHGILGNRNNWRFFGRRLAEALPAWSIVVIDQRHHGESSGAPLPDTVDACADDLANLAAHLGVRPRVTIGHSFGGKVVLSHAARHAPGLDQVWVLDAPPGPGQVGGEDHEVVQVFRALREVAMPLQRREQIVAELTSRGLSTPMAVWMTTNLAPVDNAPGFVFRFDLDGAERLIRDYFQWDGWPVLLAPRVKPAIHVVRAERSDRWDEATLARFATVPAGVPTSLHMLPDAGHWLHADNPKALLTLLAGHIQALAQ